MVNFAVVVPLANEADTFDEFTSRLMNVLDFIGYGTIYFVVDNVSKDNTLERCHALSNQDKRFNTIWAPQNKNVVDAYLKGYEIALNNNHEIIIEMDAGLSHDPNALPMFVRVLCEGNECAFGSRFINGGSIFDSNYKRHFLSKVGTLLSNILLGTKMYDMTSGYQGFHARIVKKILDYGLLSEGHFYQTEIRYLLRESKFSEVPIHYRAPSPSISKKSIYNSINTLMFYFFMRLTLKSRIIN